MMSRGIFGALLVGYLIETEGSRPGRPPAPGVMARRMRVRSPGPPTRKLIFTPGDRLDLTPPSGRLLGRREAGATTQIRTTYAEQGLSSNLRMLLSADRLAT